MEPSLKSQESNGDEYWKGELVNEKLKQLSWNRNQKQIGCLYLSQHRNLAEMTFSSFTYYVKKH